MAKINKLADKSEICSKCPDKDECSRRGPGKVCVYKWAVGEINVHVTFEQDVFKAYTCVDGEDFRASGCTVDEAVNLLVDQLWAVCYTGKIVVSCD